MDDLGLPPFMETSIVVFPEYVRNYGRPRPSWWFPAGSFLLFQQGMGVKLPTIGERLRFPGLQMGLNSKYRVNGNSSVLTKCNGATMSIR
jgi:hypothetical protein